MGVSLVTRSRRTTGPGRRRAEARKRRVMRAHALGFLRQLSVRMALSRAPNKWADISRFRTATRER